jgi:GT2 family glycosyltransferase
MDHRISVVIATRDRRASLGRTLLRLRALPEAPRVVVVDNASDDDTVEHVRHEHPGVRLIELGDNAGSAARNIGVQQAGTPYVAFSDDDSWWEPGSLALAASLLDRHPRFALLAARVLVGPSAVIDPTCEAMASSPLPLRGDSPGPAVLGFLACGAVVRRSAFLESGGFEVRFGVGGEEELLAIDLAAAGWGLAYCEDMVARHHPTASGPRPGRRRTQYRNALWSAWLRRSLPSALRRTALVAACGCHDRDARAAFRDALAGLAWVLPRRHPVPSDLERALRTLEHRFVR